MGPIHNLKVMMEGGMSGSKRKTGSTTTTTTEVGFGTGQAKFPIKQAHYTLLVWCQLCIVMGLRVEN